MRLGGCHSIPGSFRAFSPATSGNITSISSSHLSLPSLFIYQHLHPFHLKHAHSFSSSKVLKFAMAEKTGLHAQMPKGMTEQPTAGFQFEDYLPMMAEKLGEEGFMEELCNGFRLLADPEKGLITFNSLKRNAALLGMGMDYIKDEELQAMIEEGDLDGDGALDEREFCIVMVRLSPSFLVEEARKAAMDDATHDLQKSVQEKTNGLEK